MMKKAKKYVALIAITAIMLTFTGCEAFDKAGDAVFAPLNDAVDSLWD